MPVTAFRLEGAQGDEYWLGLPNFFVITRYNRSVMYAMAVNQLAESLVAARGAN
ncbi:Membrane-bound lytic murein transglycosylase B precursor [compost metagenome]